MLELVRQLVPAVHPYSAILRFIAPRTVYLPYLPAINVCLLLLHFFSNKA